MKIVMKTGWRLLSRIVSRLFGWIIAGDGERAKDSDLDLVKVCDHTYALRDNDVPSLPRGSDGRD